MEIISFCDNYDNANTYLVINGGDALVIDPANNVKILNKYLENKHLVGILLTHAHYDHFKELNNLMKILPTKVYLHPQALIKLKDPNANCSYFFSDEMVIDLKEDERILVEDSKEYQIGNFLVKVLYLPGHTNCSCGYLIEDNLFIGDVLFYNSIGRYDLPTSSLAATLSTKERIKKLNPNLHIYPGHEQDFILKEHYYLKQK